LVYVLFFFPSYTGTSSITEFPFVISVHNKLILAGNTAFIDIQFLGSHVNASKFELFILNPIGKYDRYDSLNNKTIRYPKNENAYVKEEGNYQILLAPKMGNETLASQNFTALPNQFSLHFKTISSYLSGLGLAITIPFIGSLIIAIYEYLSNRHSEKNTKLVEKSKWIIEKAKNYMELAEANKRICDCYLIRPVNQANNIEFVLDFNDKAGMESYKFENVQEYEILFFRLVDFFNSHKEFMSQVGFYYFDNVMAEDFLNRLSTRIFKRYRDIGLSSQISRYKELGNNQTDQNLTNIQKTLLENKIKSERQTIMDNFQKILHKNIDRDFYFDLYFDHLLYELLLIVCVNDGALVTYSMPHKVQKTLRLWVNQIYEDNLDIGNDNYKRYVKGELRKRLIKYFEDLNCTFYDGKKNFFRLTLGYKNVLHDSLIELIRRWTYNHKLASVLLLSAVLTLLVVIFRSSLI
jgi:hypothetical protein